MNKKASYIFKKMRFFKVREKYSGGWSELDSRDRNWEDFYRRRWQYDKVVRTTQWCKLYGVV